jgi:phosphate/sulfate permease
MDYPDWLTQARLPLVFALAFAIAANDAVTGMASAVGSRLLPGRLAALLAAAAAALPLLLLAGPAASALLARSLPDLPALAIAPVEMVAAGLATLVVVLVATILGRAVPALLLLAAGLGAPLLAAGAEPAALMPLLPIAVAAAALPLAAGLLALLAMRLLIRPVLTAPRPRDRMAKALPVLAGLSAGVGVWLIVEGAGVAYAGARLPAWLAPGLGLAAGLAGFALMTIRLAGRPFWVANRRAGAEAGHGRLTLAGSLTLAFAAGGQQAILATALLAVALPGAGAAADPAAAWPTLLIVAALGVFAGLALIGAIPARRHGAAVADSPAAGAGANLAAGAALAAGGAAGLPLPGGPAAAGALLGARTGAGRGKALAGLLANWLLAILAVAGLSLGALQVLAPAAG